MEFRIGDSVILVTEAFLGIGVITGVLSHRYYVKFPHFGVVYCVSRADMRKI